MSTISERLLAILNEKGLSYGELANLTGIPKSALQRYATGVTRKIPLDRIEAIADALAVPAAEILGWDTAVDYSNEIPEIQPDHDADLKAAFFGGYSDDLSQEEIDELWADAQDYARFKAQQRINRKKNQSEE